MNESIVIIKNAFSSEFCNRCFAILASNEGEIGGEHHLNVVDPEIRRSKISFLTGVFKHLDIYEPVLRAIHNANQEYYGFDLDAIQPPQLTEYDDSYKGEYKPHLDIDPPDANGIQRKLSMVVQLSKKDSYEGGELQFPNASEYDVSITKEQGTAIIFPSYLLHGVTPVTNGLRKSLVVWAIGQKFR